jgi:hypothetical protein
VLVDAIGNHKADSGGASSKKDIPWDQAFDGQRFSIRFSVFVQYF